MKKSVNIITLGCSKNLVDSEFILKQLEANDYTVKYDSNDKTDVVILNTCGFINDAKEESIESILNYVDAKKAGLLEKLYVIGCLSERYKEDLQRDIPEVDKYFGVNNYEEIVKGINADYKKELVGERIITTPKHYAYLKISDGCDRTCSFCAIPAFKGKLNSRPLGSIEAEVKKLVSQGYFDFSFVSQDSSSYLKDFNIHNGLEQLIKKIEKIDGVKSARILYLYPSTTTKKLIQAICDSTLFHTYYDIPLQHITSNVLKIMKRGKGTDQLKELMQYMKNMPNSFIRSTFIVGHPGETIDDFNELCNYLKEYKFDRVNIFSYSDEDGTGAYNLKDKIDQNIIDHRAEVLGNIVTEITNQKL